MKRKVLVIDDMCIKGSQSGQSFIDGIKGKVKDKLEIIPYEFETDDNFEEEIIKAIEKSKTAKVDAVLLDVNFGVGANEKPLGITFALPKLVSIGMPVIVYSYVFKDAIQYKDMASEIQKHGKTCLISEDQLDNLFEFVESLYQSPENFTFQDYGFKYRTENDINQRNQIQTAFNKSAELINSKPIEVPLIAPIKNFLGDNNIPRPLSSKESNKLFATVANDGNPLSVRYEGTALVAKHVANELREGKGSNFLYHYFQEMVRVEFAEDLDDNHYRAFYQGGLEMFSLEKEQHIKNIDNLVKFINTFTTEMHPSLRAGIRVSHINILNKPLNYYLGKSEDKFAKNKIRHIMEKESMESLKNLLVAIKPDKKLESLLICLKQAQIDEITVSEGIKILLSSGEYSNYDISELIEIQSLCENWENCSFDPGILRSLNFYSGITLQGDILKEGEKQLEAFGGGGFTGMVESFGFFKQTVHSFGLAFGVERLMNIIKK